MICHHMMTNYENVEIKTMAREDSVLFTSLFLPTLTTKIPLEEKRAEITLKNCSKTYFADYLVIKCIAKFFVQILNKQ